MLACISELGVMPYTAKLWCPVSDISSLNDLHFTQGHRVVGTGKSELAQLFWRKVVRTVEVTQIFVMVDYNYKKLCKFGKRRLCLNTCSAFLHSAVDCCLWNIRNLDSVSALINSLWWSVAACPRRCPMPSQSWLNCEFSVLFVFNVCSGCLLFTDGIVQG